MSADQLIADAIRLWRAHGGPAGDIRTEAYAVSGNNRVFVLAAVDGAAKVVAKSYFRDGDGGRKRLEAECLFLEYAARAGIANVSRTVAFDTEGLLGLYRFVGGRKLDRSEIGEIQILAAADFIRALNVPSGTACAATLPNAAEACFSVAEHFALVDRRLERLAMSKPVLPVDFRAAELVTELAAFWQTIRQGVETRSRAFGLALDQSIARHERVISPSDFGFHNALVSDGGNLTFVDFEYAGWDDVAKLVADFFFQPAIPVNSSLFDIFMNQVTLDFPEGTATRERIRLLRPIFGVKWCCIMLNCFLPDMAARRRFADPGHDEARQKLAQLVKAEDAFRTLTKMPWHT